MLPSAAPGGHRHAQAVAVALPATPAGAVMRPAQERAHERRVALEPAAGEDHLPRHDAVVGRHAHDRAVAPPAVAAPARRVRTSAPAADHRAQQRGDQGPPEGQDPARAALLDLGAVDAARAASSAYVTGPSTFGASRTSGAIPASGATGPGSSGRPPSFPPGRSAW